MQVERQIAVDRWPSFHAFVCVSVVAVGVYEYYNMRWWKSESVSRHRCRRRRHRYSATAPRRRALALSSWCTKAHAEMHSTPVRAFRLARARARGEGVMCSGYTQQANEQSARAPGTRRRRRRRRRDNSRVRRVGWCGSGEQSASSSCKPEFGAHRPLCCLRSVQRLIA